MLDRKRTYVNGDSSTAMIDLLVNHLGSISRKERISDPPKHRRIMEVPKISRATKGVVMLSSFLVISILHAARNKGNFMVLHQQELGSTYFFFAVQNSSSFTAKHISSRCFIVSNIYLIYRCFISVPSKSWKSHRVHPILRARHDGDVAPSKELQAAPEPGACYVVYPTLGWNRFNWGWVKTLSFFSLLSDAPAQRWGWVKTLVPSEPQNSW